MNTKSTLAMTVLVVLGLMVFALGCSGPSGRFVVAHYTDHPVTIGQITENWSDYEVAYAGLGLNHPSAILFDPKKDERRITYNKWIPITRQEDLAMAVKWIQAEINFPPALWAVYGPDGNFYGYIYSHFNSVYMKMREPNTLFLGDLPLPPFDYGPGAGIHP